MQTSYVISHLLGALILLAGCALAAVAGLLAWDDIKAREWEHDNAYLWEDAPSPYLEASK